MIDEFQYLFAERDAVATTAAQLLEDVARRGRSQGIHLVLASQDVSGIEAFWGKPAIFEQFILRIALPKARRVLVETERRRRDAAPLARGGEPRVRCAPRQPDRTHSRRDQQGHVRRSAATVVGEGASRYQPPRLFDGSHVPALADTGDFRASAPSTGVPVAVLGQIIDVAGSAALTTLAGAPGRNLAVIGSSAPDAASVLGAAGLSVARQHMPGSGEVHAVPAGRRRDATGGRLAERLRLDGHDVSVVERDGLRGVPGGTRGAAGRRVAPRQPHYVFLYGVDGAQADAGVAATGVYPATGLDHLRTVLRHGPEHHTHVFGWWRGVGRLKASLPIGQVEDIGPWVAFDVQGQELSTLAPGQLISWSPRARRGLFFDRFAHARPQVIIPFDVDKGDE